jgi:hypothetical protein
VKEKLAGEEKKRKRRKMKQEKREDLPFSFYLLVEEEDVYEEKE